MSLSFRAFIIDSGSKAIELENYDGYLQECTLEGIDENRMSLFGCNDMLIMVKLQPDVFPGVVLVGAVGGDLAGEDQKAFPRPGLVFAGDAFRVVAVQLALARDDIVEQVVVAHEGAEGVQGCALLPAILIEPQVQKVFIWEDKERKVIHAVAHPL